MIDVAEVVRLRDNQHLPFKEIGQRLGVCATTVIRAYDQGNPYPVRDAAERGKKPRRGTYSHLPQQAFERIRAGLAAGHAAAKIAADVECGVSTVYREKRKSLANSAARKS
jgi:IS30 family transposase